MSTVVVLDIITRFLDKPLKSFEAGLELTRLVGHKAGEFKVREHGDKVRAIWRRWLVMGSPNDVNNGGV